MDNNLIKDNKNQIAVSDQNADFLNIYNKSHRLSAAVFMISNVIEQSEELKSKIKKLSLDMVSLSVQLKDTTFLDARKLILEIEKNSLELMSMLDIASIAGLISQMNASILKEEFEYFLKQLNIFSQKFEVNKNISVKSIFDGHSVLTSYVNDQIAPAMKQFENNFSNSKESNKSNSTVIENTDQNKKDINRVHKRKDIRKDTILDFIKGHNNVSIKDIVPNIIGCSEKTVQRELINLINEGKIKKTGERRWSKYSLV